MNILKKRITVGIVAHVDAGKTTLTEALLYTCGMIKTVGRVDNQDAFLDTDALEKSRGITIFSKEAVLEFQDFRIQLLDTPGHTDFSAEMERTLAVLDYAILVISAASGVQSYTKTLWRLLKAYRLPVFIWMNKVDQPGADPEKLLLELQRELDSRIIPFWADEEQMFDAAAMCSERLMDAYLKNNTLSEMQIQAAIAGRDVFPCYFGSALKLQGMDHLLSGLQKYTLHYPQLHGLTDRSWVGKICIYVYKITRDEENTRLTHIRLLSGAIEPKMMIGKEKIQQIRIYNGKKYENVSRLVLGETAVLTGLQESFAGQFIGEEGSQGGDFFFRYHQEKILYPVLNYEMLLPEGTDAFALLPGLRQIGEEYPEMEISWDERQQKILVHLMGEVQTEILREIVAKRLGIVTEFSEGSIIYRETIRARAEGVGHFEPLKHYAEVHVLLEPLERGKGIEISSHVSVDELAENWQNQILEILRSSTWIGALAGYELTDIRITLIGGRSHIKHTSGGDFKEATIRALRHGLLQLRDSGDLVLLEPYYAFRLEIPAVNLGRALHDLNTMSADFSMPDIQDENAIIMGNAPVSKMQNYTAQVLAYTKGYGHLELSIQGFYPCHNTEAVLEKLDYDPENDPQNPAYSVFCSHGEGFFVPWHAVHEYMHVDSGLKLLTSSVPEEEISMVRSTYDEHKADSEELMAIFERTYGKIKPRIGDWDKPIQKPKPEKPYIFKERKPVREYILVDGYNVIFAWKELRALAEGNIEAAVESLAEMLANYRAYRDMDVILVFDAYRIKGHQTEIREYVSGQNIKQEHLTQNSMQAGSAAKKGSSDPKKVRPSSLYIVYTKEAETADRYIEKTSHELGQKYQVTVVTSDGMEQIIIRSQGCLLMSALEFYEEVHRIRGAIQENIEAAAPGKGAKSYLLDGISEGEKRKWKGLT